MKPKVFLGSSSEAKKFAQALIALLPEEHNQFEIIPWYDEDFFGLSEVTLSVLEKRAQEFDFGIFLLHSEDKAEIRGQEYTITRDNVLLELGMFIGQLGVEKCFFATSDDKNYKLASDLLGFTRGTIFSSEGDINAMSKFAKQTKQKIEEILGQRNGHLSGEWKQTWYAKGSSNFPEENTSIVNVVHREKNFTALFEGGGDTYKIEGKVGYGYVIGTWYDPVKEDGYRGAFQFAIAKNGRSMKGFYLGNKDSAPDVWHDEWVWEKLQSV